jgi:hypothetical protein
MDTETEEQICQYIGKGFIIPNVGEFVIIKTDDDEIRCTVDERVFSYRGDWANNCCVVSIWVKKKED